MIPIIDAVLEIIGKVIPDPQQRAEAELKLLQLRQTGELSELQTRLGPMLAEAQSPDPYTSRARPSFLYVCYIIILAAIPMAGIHAFSPDTAESVTVGFKLWLAAIPPSITDLMTFVMLGYIGGRSYEKVKGLK